MKICFYARALYNKLCPLLFDELKKELNQNVSAIFVTQNINETRNIKKNYEDANICEVTAWFKENWYDFTEERLYEYEKKYDCTPVWSIIYADRFLISQKRDYVVRVVCGYFAFYENLFRKGDIDLYYDESIALASSYIAYIVGKYHGVQYIAQMIARGHSATHHYYMREPYQYNCNFRENYMEIDYADEVLKVADEYLHQYETQNIKPAYMKITGRKPSLRFKSVAAFYYYFKYRKNADCFDYINKDRHKTAFNEIKFFIRYMRCKGIYNTPDLSHKYVYYPLHYQPEASTLVCAQKYEKQMFFIDSWAKSLPADTMLYIKEHYAVLGHRDISFYKQLNNYPNVLLVDPWFNSKTLIEHAQAVTTLTGTAGWEAMLLRKPTILGGRIFFDNAPGVVRVDDIYGAYNEVMQKWERPDRNRLIRYIAEYFVTMYEGSIYTVDPNCYSEKNIKNLVASLLGEMQRRGIIPKLSYRNNTERSG